MAKQISQVDAVDVKSKWLPWRRLLSPVNVPFAESQLSSLVTLYYSFHTFEFFHLLQKAAKKRIGTRWGWSKEYIQAMLTDV